MARYGVAPTKSNLIRVKQELQFAREGHELLDQKRQILVAELMSMMQRTQDFQEKVDRQLMEAYASLRQTIVRMGKNAFSQAANAVNLITDISLFSRKIMGVRVPVVETHIEDRSPYYSLSGTSFWLDVTVARFKALLPLLGELAQLRLSVLRLAREVNKTIRRVNALEKFSIPDFEETLKYIQDVLEEQDRENLFILKLIKGRITKELK